MLLDFPRTGQCYCYGITRTTSMKRRHTKRVRDADELRDIRQMAADIKKEKKIEEEKDGDSEDQEIELT